MPYLYTLLLYLLICGLPPAYAQQAAPHPPATVETLTELLYTLDTSIVYAQPQSGQGELRYDAATGVLHFTFAHPSRGQIIRLHRVQDDLYMVEATSLAKAQRSRLCWVRWQAGKPPVLATAQVLPGGLLTTLNQLLGTGFAEEKPGLLYPGYEAYTLVPDYKGRQLLVQKFAGENNDAPQVAGRLVWQGASYALAMQ